MISNCSVIKIQARFIYIYHITIDMDAVLVVIFVVAFLYEIIDSSIGQGYGTLGTPTFILIGLDAFYIIPCILLSQAIGGFIGGLTHHNYGNLDLKNNLMDITNTKILILVGVIGVVFGVFIMSRVPSLILDTYIGIIVVIIGVLLITGIKFVYTKKKMLLLSIFASFNKGFSGGGYGGLATGGQIVIGNSVNHSVGVTTIAEAPICLTGFIIWCLLYRGLPPLWMLIPMCLGAGLAPLIGAKITAFGEEKVGRKFTISIAIVIIILGASTLWKVASKFI